MTENQARRGLGEHLDEVRDAVVDLGGMVVDRMADATRTLLERDLDGARKLIEDDDVIDALTVAIEDRCFHLLVLQSPMAGDMRAVVCALSLASEIERCGDLATNISKTARRLYDVELDPSLRGMIDRMSTLAVRQLRFAIDAYRDADEGRAAALDDLDDELDNLHRTFVEAIFSSHGDKALDLRVGVQLALLGRYYERMGDHAVNIGERVQYQVSGWMPEHDGAIRARARSEVAQVDAVDAESSVADRGVVVADAVKRRQIERLRRDFVANIGHELRTPVGALLVLAETLHDEVDRLEGVADTSTVRRLSDRLVHEAGRMGRTIDDLLELSRLESGDSMTPTTVDAGEIVDEALERVAAAIDLAGIEIASSRPDHPVVLEADRRQLVSALANLLDNAVKYSEEGATVELRVEAADGVVRFVVRDEGVGIPSADQAKVFERFFRVDRARRRDTGGTGLGLAIVRHVALNHEGTVELQSGEGEGSTFTLAIPAVREQAPLRGSDA